MKEKKVCTRSNGPCAVQAVHLFRVCVKGINHGIVVAVGPHPDVGAPQLELRSRALHAYKEVDEAAAVADFLDLGPGLGKVGSYGGRDGLLRQQLLVCVEDPSAADDAKLGEDLLATCAAHPTPPPTPHPPRKDVSPSSALGVRCFLFLLQYISVKL